MDALNWRKASYSASNGGGCVEVGGTPSAVLVRDTQDRTGPVLTFSAGAWRRFADQVKRSLATGPWRGTPGGPGVPLGVSGGIPSLAGAARGRVPTRRHLFSACTGVGVVSESVVVRGARSGRRGSGFPRCLQLPPAGSRGAVCVFAVRSAPA
jgi:hypothetical protein